MSSSDHFRDGRRVLQEIEVEMQEGNPDPGVNKENEEPLDETPRQPPYTQYEHSQPVQLSPSFATPPVIDVSRAPRQQQNSINQPLNLSLPAVGTINLRRTRWSKDWSTRRCQVRKQKRWQRQQEAQVIEEAAMGGSLTEGGADDCLSDEDIGMDIEGDCDDKPNKQDDNEDTGLWGRWEASEGSTEEEEAQLTESDSSKRGKGLLVPSGDRPTEFLPSGTEDEDYSDSTEEDDTEVNKRDKGEKQVAGDNGGKDEREDADEEEGEDEDKAD
ncbi:hypothetical protein BGX38DRAFT_1278748 [Terfezia claveryi]|nr:hypothetical protein BGX38DRAFT_1278748 [Terfezia claveryi]